MLSARTVANGSGFLEIHMNRKSPKRRNRAVGGLGTANRLPDVAMEIARRRPVDWLSDQNFEIARCYAEMRRFNDAWEAILHALRYWQGPNKWDLDSCRSSKITHRPSI
jgi:hypothetical protein